MRTHHALVLAVGAFAVSLCALSVAAISAWLRCGRGSDCSSELALGIVGIAPAALLLIIVLLLIGREAPSSGWARILVVATLAVAVTPLAAFLIRDAWTLAIMVFLFSALVSLALWDDQRSRERSEDENDIVETPKLPLVQASRSRWHLEARVGALREKVALHAEGSGPPNQRSEWIPDPRAHTNVILALARMHDFEGFAVLYETVERLEGVSNVVVDYFDVNWGVMEITVRSPRLAESVIDVLNVASAGVAVLRLRQA